MSLIRSPLGAGISFFIIGWAFVFAGALRGEELSRWEVEQFAHQKLHEKSDDAKAAMRCFKVIEDDEAQAESGKVLAASMNKRLIRKDDFAVLNTPSVSDLKIGIYRATVRMKMQGMANSLGTAIVLSAGGQKRAIYLNEFDEEDAYQEFSLDFEIREGDVVTRQAVPSRGAPGGPGSLVRRKNLEAIEESLKINDLPWLDRMTHYLMGRLGLARELKEKRERDQLFKLLKEAIEAAGGRDLEFNAEKVEPRLDEKIVEMVNQFGRSGSSVAVSVYFPKNTTGQARGSTRGPATPHPTLRKVFIDWIKIDSIPEPEHPVVRDVTARFPWRRPGEKQTFRIWLHNRTGNDREGKVRLKIRHGLLKESVLQKKQIKLEDGRYDRLEWDWIIPKDHPLWGQTILAEYLQEGEVVSSARSWFAIHPFSNAVMIHDRPNTSRYQHPYKAYPRTQNHKELFGATCTIYDSAGVVPDDDIFFEPYVVGNGSYFMSIPTLMSITRGLLSQGMAPFYYLESSGSSHGGYKIFFEHPDWVPKAPANTDEFLLNRKADIERGLKFWRGELKTEDGKWPTVTRGGGAYSGQLVALNGIIKENVDRVIRGSLKLVDHAPFVGIRWDGLGFRAYNSKSLGGNFGKTAEECAQISAENVRRFRKEVREEFPAFEIRANGGISALSQRQKDPFNYDRAYEIMDADPHHKAVIEGHGSIMEEYWMGYAGFGSYTNVCRNYLRGCHFENSAMKYAGGHNGHMHWFYDALCQYTPDEIYQQLFTFLGGAHLDGAFGPIVESGYDLGLYAIRFSEYFWDPELRPIPGLQDMVTVDAESDIWCTEAGFQKAHKKDHRIFVLPVINPPVTERWLQNRFGQLPAPIKEPFGMTVQVPEGYTKAVGVYLLENKPYPEMKRLEFEDNDGEVWFEIPELQIFKVVVVEFSK
ncbi:MAG: hypothetical protein QGF00_09665 [Planctomycetota bacterium]|nr:hypothetical protein [Planctomycetota bacterium]MDP7249855.1 hypothetical protein [Planctomycetota bacterium]